MTNKSSKYQRLFNQLKPLVEKSPTLIAQISTINSVLYHKVSGIFWSGVYFLKDKNLQVGPYQGPLACQILEYPKGVCWACAMSKKPIIVPNVELFPGHIACDSRSKSELALPIMNKKGELVAVYDIDSNQLNTFDEQDAIEIQKILKLLDSKLIEDYVNRYSS
jgi:L-methionine (R)-S-oxide reductase